MLEIITMGVGLAGYLPVRGQWKCVLCVSVCVCVCVRDGVCVKRVGQWVNSIEQTYSCIWHIQPACCHDEAMLSESF